MHRFKAKLFKENTKTGVNDAFLEGRLRNVNLFTLFKDQGILIFIINFPSGIIVSDGLPEHNVADVLCFRDKT